MSLKLHRDPPRQTAPSGSPYPYVRFLGSHGKHAARAAWLLFVLLSCGAPRADSPPESKRSPEIVSQLLAERVMRIERWAQASIELEPTLSVNLGRRARALKVVHPGGSRPPCCPRPTAS
jgi:hypothetical protein